KSRFSMRMRMAKSSARITGPSGAAVAAWTSTARAHSLTVVPSAHSSISAYSSSVTLVVMPLMRRVLIDSLLVPAHGHALPVVSVRGLASTRAPGLVARTHGDGAGYRQARRRLPASSPATGWRVTRGAPLRRSLPGAEGVTAAAEQRADVRTRQGRGA